MSPIRPDTDLGAPHYSDAELRVLRAAVRHSQSLVQADHDPADPVALLDWPTGLELVSAVSQLDPEVYEVADLDHPSDMANLARAITRQTSILDTLVESAERIAAVLERESAQLGAIARAGGRR